MPSLISVVIAATTTFLAALVGLPNDLPWVANAAVLAVVFLAALTVATRHQRTPRHRGR